MHFEWPLNNHIFELVGNATKHYQSNKTTTRVQMIIKLALRIWTDFGSATTIQRQSNNHSHQMTTTPKTQINFANIKWQIFDKEGGDRPGVGGATTIQARNCPLLLPINPHTLLCCCSTLLLLYSAALILCCCTAVLLLWTILPFCSYMQSAALLCYSATLLL